jgi:HSP20 family protein
MHGRGIRRRYVEIVAGVPRTFRDETWEYFQRRGLEPPFFRPASDVIETADAYLVVLELPGVADEDVEILVHPDALVVSGLRQAACDCGARYLRAEIRHGPFRFDMPLPRDADPASVDATQERGLLRVVLRKQTRRDP